MELENTQPRATLVRIALPIAGPSDNATLPKLLSVFGSCIMTPTFELERAVMGEGLPGNLSANPYAEGPSWVE